MMSSVVPPFCIVVVVVWQFLGLPARKNLGRVSGDMTMYFVFVYLYWCICVFCIVYCALCAHCGCVAVFRVESTQKGGQGIR